MAFTSKIGNLLRQTVSKHINSELSTPNPSIYQAIRWMSSSKLFVGGLSYGTDDHSLGEAFASYGEVIEAKVIMDRETGRSRGFGFVSFTSNEEASAAITGMDGKDLHGRMVRVDYAADRSRGGGYGGGGYGGGGYGGGGYGGGGSYGGGGYGDGGGNYGGGGGSYSGGGGGNYGGGGGSYGGGGGGNYGSAGSSGGNYGGGGSTGGYSGDGFGSNSAGSTGSSGGGNYGVAGAGIGNYGVEGGVGSSDNYAGVTGGGSYAAGGNTGSFGASGGAGYGSNEPPYTTSQGSMNARSYAQDEPLEGNSRDDDDQPDDYVNKRG